MTDAARPFYGAECPQYPNCAGGCGLGCSKEVGARADAARQALLDRADAYFGWGSQRENPFEVLRDMTNYLRAPVPAAASREDVSEAYCDPVPRLRALADGCRIKAELFGSDKMAVASHIWVADEIDAILALGDLRQPEGYQTYRSANIGPQFELTGGQPETAGKVASCPFCSCTDTQIADTGSFWIECAGCYAEGPPTSSEDEAIRLWNRAASPPPSDRAKVVEECARIVEGRVIFERYREWPAASSQGNRDRDSEIVRLCDALAKAIRALSPTDAPSPAVGAHDGGAAT